LGGFGEEVVVDVEAVGVALGEVYFDGGKLGDVINAEAAGSAADEEQNFREGELG
jgi:hypothetical protein